MTNSKTQLHVLSQIECAPNYIYFRLMCVITQTKTHSESTTNSPIIYRSQETIVVIVSQLPIILYNC